MALVDKKAKMINATAETAESIHGDDFSEAWHAVQLDFWLLARETMLTSGYDKLRRRMPNISIECAELLASLSPSDIEKTLCNGTFSSLMPAFNCTELLGAMRSHLRTDMPHQKLKTIAMTLRKRKVQNGLMR